MSVYEYPTELQEAGIHPVIKAVPVAVKSPDPFEPSDDWLEHRSMSVGSSDISGAILGGNQYSDPAKVWEAKKGKVSRPANNAMITGSLMQPHIEEMALAWLRQFYPQAERFEGGEQTWEAFHMDGMTATPDLLVATNTNPDIDPNVPRGIIVEIKFTANFGQYVRKVESDGKVRTEFCPPDYVLYQIQHQLAILNDIYGNPDAWKAQSYDVIDTDNGKQLASVEKGAGTAEWDWAGAIAVFPVGYVPGGLLGPGQHIVVSPAPIWPARNTIMEMEKAGSAMLTCLRTGRAPWTDSAPDYYKDSDVGTPEAADKIAVKESVVIASEHDILTHSNIVSMENDIKPIQDLITEEKDSIKAKLKTESADKLVSDDGEVLATYGAADVLDWDGFCREAGIETDSDVLESVICHPAVAAEHTKPSDKTRRLSIKK